MEDSGQRQISASHDGRLAPKPFFFGRGPKIPFSAIALRNKHKQNVDAVEVAPLIFFLSRTIQ